VLFVIVVFQAGTFPEPQVYGIIRIQVQSIFTAHPKDAESVIVHSVVLVV
jgi:hypothetical protein